MKDERKDTGAGTRGHGEKRSHFHFFSASPRRPVPVSFPGVDMARKSILVVDDEKSQREILEMILSEEGYDVTTASSGEAAMKFAKERRFDLALTDLKMTGMDGIELLQHLLELDSSIIVLLLTAHGSIDSAKEALRRGAFDYLLKPFDQAALLDTIKRALGNLD